MRSRNYGPNFSVEKTKYQNSAPEKVSRLPGASHPAPLRLPLVPEAEKPSPALPKATASPHFPLSRTPSVPDARLPPGSASCSTQGLLLISGGGQPSEPGLAAVQELSLGQWKSQRSPLCGPVHNTSRSQLTTSVWSAGLLRLCPQGTFPGSQGPLWLLLLIWQ